MNDPNKTGALEQAISGVSEAIRNVIQNGKVLHQSPQNQNAGSQFQNSISQLSQSMKNVLGETTKLNQQGGNNNNNQTISNNNNQKNGGSVESQKLTGVCVDLHKTLDNLIEELMPPFSTLHQRSMPPPEKGSISMNKLRRLAEDAIAALEQLKPFRDYTPKETFKALEFALEATDLFKERLGSKANNLNIQSLKNKMLESKKNIEGGSSLLLKDTESYISVPKDPQAKKVDGDIQTLINEISRIIDDIQPTLINVVSSTLPYNGKLTPSDLKKQAEVVKKDCEETQKLQSKLPSQTKKDVEKTFDDTDTFVSMVEKLALDANNPGYKNFLNESASQLRKAQEGMVGNANSHFEEPENPSHAKAIDQECERIKKLVDKVIEESTPRVTSTFNVDPSRVKNFSPSDLESAVDRMKEVVSKHGNEHAFMAPKELVNSANDCSKNVGDIVGILKARAMKTDNPELKNDLLKAANNLENGNKKLMQLNNSFLDDPTNVGISRGISDECKKLMEIADEILQKVKPKAEKTPLGSVSCKFEGTITPKDVEKLGEEVKKEVTKVQNYKGKAPVNLVSEATDASRKAEQLADLLENMAKQADRPATKKKLAELANVLRNKNDGMIDQLNAYIENPDDPSTGKALDVKCQDLKNFVDKIIDEVKPKVVVSKVETGGSSFTPKDIFESAKLVKIFIFLFSFFISYFFF